MLYDDFPSITFTYTWQMQWKCSFFFAFFLKIVFLKSEFLKSELFSDIW
jgi:hypothetical protein